MSTYPAAKSALDGVNKIFSNVRDVHGRKRLVVVGHRGMGKNFFGKSFETFGHSIMENTLLSFNRAAENSADFVEFDVQVTKDGHPVLFHDKYLIAEGKKPSLIKDLTLHEFLSYKSEETNGSGELLRYFNPQKILKWIVHENDSFCTLKQFFSECDPKLGANLEIKFSEDDSSKVDEAEVNRMLDSILPVVEEHARDRKLFFSSFIPDAVIQLRKRQETYPVFFLTDGGETITTDPRMNSISSAVDLCLKHGLDGIVSEVRALIKHPSEIERVKNSGLILLTYGTLNNFAPAIRFQHLQGVDGVIVDKVRDVVQEAKALAEAPESSNKYSTDDLNSILDLEKTL